MKATERWHSLWGVVGGDDDKEERQREGERESARRVQRTHVILLLFLLAFWRSPTLARDAMDDIF